LAQTRLLDYVAQLLTIIAVCLITTCSELRKVLFLTPSVSVFWFVYEISREPLNVFAPNSQGKRVWSLALTNLRAKVKSQMSRSPDTKNGILGPVSGLRAVYECLVKHR